MAGPVPKDAALAGALANSVLDQIAVGIMLVDRNLRLRLANEAANRFLREADYVRLHAGRLSAAQPAQTRRLMELAREVTRASAMLPAAARASGCRALTLENPATGGLLFLTLHPFSGPVGGGIGDGDGASTPDRLCLISAAAPGRMQGPSREALSEIWGLTKREAQVVSGLARGQRVENVAAEMNITVNTARSYVKSVFSKVGVTSQMELVRLALTGVNWVEAG